MDKKGGEEMPSFVVEMIGVLIVLGILFIIFAGFSGPMLEFIANYEAAKSFSRISDTLSTACEQGIDTISYINLPGTRNPFAISVVNSKFSNKISELRLCTKDGEGPCTTRTSVSNVADCNDEDLCYCLLRFELGEDDAENPYKLNNEFDIVVIGLHDEGDYDSINDYVNYITDKLDLEENNEKILKVEALRCISINETCSYDDSPVMFGMYEEGTVLWIHTRGRETGSTHESLYFGSFSAHRAIKTVHLFEYYYYFNVYTNPIYEIINVAEEGISDMIITT